MAEHDDFLKLLNRMDALEDTVSDLVKLLRGEDGAPGLVGRVARHHASLYGTNDREFGLVHKVNVVWRAYIWLLCTASAGIGILTHWIFTEIIRH